MADAIALKGCPPSIARMAGLEAHKSVGEGDDDPAVIESVFAGASSDRLLL
jgi:hypothetical protein